MKKLTLLLTVLLCAAFLLAACAEEQPMTTVATVPPAPTDPTTPPTDPTSPPTDPTVSPTDLPTNPTELTIPLPTVPGNPLEYQPGKIKLVSRESDNYNFERKYRLTYYLRIFWTTNRLRILQHGLRTIEPKPIMENFAMKWFWFP